MLAVDGRAASARTDLVTFLIDSSSFRLVVELMGTFACAGRDPSDHLDHLGQIGQAEVIKTDKRTD